MGWNWNIQMVILESTNSILGFPLGFGNNWDVKIDCKIGSSGDFSYNSVFSLSIKNPKSIDARPPDYQQSSCSNSDPVEFPGEVLVLDTTFECVYSINSEVTVLKSGTKTSPWHQTQPSRRKNESAVRSILFTKGIHCSSELFDPNLFFQSTCWSWI